MDAVHRFVGFGVVAGFALLALWALFSFVRNKAPGGAFWGLLAAMQIVIGIQVVVGGILFAMGGRPDTQGPEWLHYTYGGLFPAAVLLGAHRMGRRMEDVAWMAFGVAAFVNFGLTLRALQTGLGVA